MADKRVRVTSPAGVAFVGNEEGWVPVVYLCPAGRKTIGYGHLISGGESFKGPLTKQQGLDLLRSDLAVAERAVNESVKVPLRQGQFDALVSLAFNIGAGAFRGSTLVRLLNAGDVAGASAEFSKWSLANGKRNAILVGRRGRERAMFDAPPPEAPRADDRYDLRVPDPLHIDEE